MVRYTVLEIGSEHQIEDFHRDLNFKLQYEDFHDPTHRNYFYSDYIKYALNIIERGNFRFIQILSTNRVLVSMEK